MTPCTLQFDGAVAVVTLDDGRANALNPRMLTLLEQALGTASEAGSLIIHGREKVFCGGLDLPALTTLDRAQMTGFLELFDRVHDALLAFPVPIVTVARGSAVAGGAIVFAAGDHRLTTPQGKIGVNEAVLGLNIPTSALEILRVGLGERGAAEATLSGRLFEGQERLRVGFATEIHAPELLDERAVELARLYASNDRKAMALLRRDLRASSLSRVERDATRTRAAFLERWFADETQTRLEALVASLTRKR